MDGFIHPSRWMHLPCRQRGVSIVIRGLYTCMYQYAYIKGGQRKGLVWKFAFIHSNFSVRRICVFASASSIRLRPYRLFPRQLQHTQKLRPCVDFVHASFSKHRNHASASTLFTPASANTETTSLHRLCSRQLQQTQKPRLCIGFIHPTSSISTSSTPASSVSTSSTST